MKRRSVLVLLGGAALARPRVARAQQPDSVRRLGLLLPYVQSAQLFKGARPGDLPVEQATRFELLVNLKTAKELGVMIPPAILSRADEVIQ